MPKTKTINVYPLVALRGKVIFPDTTSSFDAGRLISLAAVSRASEREMTLFVSLQKDVSKDNILSEDISKVGTVVRIKQIAKLNSGNLRVQVEGLYRAKAEEITEEDGCFFASVSRLKEQHGDEVLEEAYFRTAQEVMRELSANDMRLSKDAISELELAPSPDVYINKAMPLLHIKEEVKQKLLETTNVVERLKLFERCLNDELEISKLEKKIGAMVRQSIDKNQKEYFLREQLKAIHTELGDDEKEMDSLSTQIRSKHMPADIEEKALKEIGRMDKMPPSSPEYTVIRNYLDWLIDLPWTEQTKDTESLTEAKKILDEDHYGLEKVKTRGLTTFYFNDRNNKDIQEYGGRQYNEKYEFGGKVVEYDEEKSVIEIKNKLQVGDKMEILVPYQLTPVQFTIAKLWDYDTKEEIDSISPGVKGQKVFMKLPIQCEKDWIIRREK